MIAKALVLDLYGTLVSIRTRGDAPAVWRKLALFYGYHGAAYAPGQLRADYLALRKAQYAAAKTQENPWPDPPVEPVFAELYRRKAVGADKVQSAAAPSVTVSPICADHLPLPGEDFTAPDSGACGDAALSFAKEAAQVMRLVQTSHIRLYPGVKAALAALRKRGLKLILLSNAQAAFTRPELRLLRLEPCFDGVYLSSDYGYAKPDPRFFAAALHAFDLEPAACLMIGNDAASDIAGAKRAGMATFYLHTETSPPPDPDDLAKADYTQQGADWRRLLPRLQEILS